MTAWLGLAPPGRARPWKLATAVTALQRAFPWSEVRCEWTRQYNGYAFIVRGHGALVISPAFFERCADEAAVEAGIAKAVMAMAKRVNPEFCLELV